MGASVTLTAPSIGVAPGGEATLEFRLRNTGTVVDEFALGVLGDAAGWSSVEPPTISLFPGAEETARIIFRPPRAPQVPAGPMPFGLHARSREDAAGSTVEEGVVEVGPFLEPFAELIPRTSRGSRSASHDLALDNRGNIRLNAEVEAADADRLLGFDVKPPGIVVEPGMAGVRQGPGQAGEALLAGHAEDASVPAGRPPGGRDAGHPRRRAPPGSRPAVLVPCVPFSPSLRC